MTPHSDGKNDSSAEANQNNTKHVSICFHREDRRAAIAIAHSLESAGVTCTIDRGEILDKESLVVAVKRVMGERCLVVVLISNSKNELWSTRSVNETIEVTRDGGQRVIYPIFLGISSETVRHNYNITTAIKYYCISNYNRKTQVLSIGNAVKEIELLVRNIAVEQQEQAGAAAEIPQGKLSARNSVIVFSALLIVLLSLTVLFGSGVLRFGAQGPLIYITYVIAGLLCSVLCFGLLDSLGRIEGSQYSTNYKLGGAIVGMVVVVLGGGLYERYLRTPEAFSIRVVLYEKTTSEPLPIAGVSGIRYGNQRPTVDIDKGGEAIIQGIPSNYRGQKADVVLTSVFYRIDPSYSQVVLDDANAIYVKVGAKPMFATSSEADAVITIVDPRSSKMSEAFGFHRTVGFQMKGLAKSERPIPIDGTAFLELTAANGLPTKKIPLKVISDNSDSGVILKANTPIIFYVEGALYPEDEKRIDQDFFGLVCVQYDSALLKEQDAKTFYTKVFPFKRAYLGFDEDSPAPANNK